MAILMEPFLDRGAFAIGTLARAPLGGGAPRQLYKSVSDADWGPGGQLALLRWTEDESRQTLEYPPGKALYEVHGSAGPWMTSPRISPDGRLIAFIEHPHGGGDLDGAVGIVDLAGRKRVISPGWATVGGLGGLAWSPRGDEIWFAAEGRTDTPGIAIRAVSLSGKERVVLTGPATFRISDLSRDGRLLMWRGNRQCTILFGGQGLARERDLSWSDTTDSDVVGLSADGKTLLFSCEFGGACLRGTDGGPVVRLGGANPIGLSPDGKWVSAHSRPSVGPDVLMLLPTGPGEPKPLSLPGLEGIFAPYPRWFPDSLHLAVSAKRGKEDRRCFIVDFEGGTPRPVSPEGTGTGKGFDCWPSPDGKWVTARQGDDKLALYPVGSGAPRFISGLAVNDRMAGWSEDSRSLYIQTLNQHWPIRVSRFDVETGRREPWKELMPSDPAGVDDPQGGAVVRLTPDGKFYAFSFRRLLSELYIVDRAR
jgi:Tol biopolymer transport system component